MVKHLRKLVGREAQDGPMPELETIGRENLNVWLSTVVQEAANLLGWLKDRSAAALLWRQGVLGQQ